MFLQFHLTSSSTNVVHASTSRPLKNHTIIQFSSFTREEFDIAILAKLECGIRLEHFTRKSRKAEQSERQFSRTAFSMVAGFVVISSNSSTISANQNVIMCILLRIKNMSSTSSSTTLTSMTCGRDFFDLCGQCHKQVTSVQLVSKALLLWGGLLTSQMSRNPTLYTSTPRASGHCEEGAELLQING